MQTREKFNYNKSHFIFHNRNFNTRKNNLFLSKLYGKFSIF